MRKGLRGLICGKKKDEATALRRAAASEPAQGEQLLHVSGSDHRRDGGVGVGHGGMRCKRKKK